MAESVKEVVPETRPRGQRRGLDRLRASGDGRASQDSQSGPAGTVVREAPPAAVPQATLPTAVPQATLPPAPPPEHLSPATSEVPAVDETAKTEPPAGVPSADQAQPAAAVDASQGTATAARASTRLGNKRFRVLVAVIALLAALVGWLAYRFWDTRSSAQADKRQYQQLSATDTRNQAILSAARQATVTLLTYDYRHLDQDFAAVLNGSTGAFKQDFASKQSTAKTLFTQGKAIASGQVLDAAVAASTPSSATVLAVVDQSVKNVSVPNGTVKHYRMQLKLTKVGSAWLVSDVEFPA